MRRLRPVLAVSVVLACVAAAGEAPDAAPNVMTAPVAAPPPWMQITRLEWLRSDPAKLAALGDDVGSRAAVARALGRLQDGGALSALSRWSDDADPRVRLAVAEALGTTPGSAAVLAEWLDATPARSAPRAPPPNDVRPAIVAGLGRQGAAEDIPRLVAALAEPWPVGSAAAEALGRMGKRQVAGASQAVPALVACLERPDPRTVEACAYALRRVGLAGSPNQGRALAAQWSDAPTGAARAWLLRAVWPDLRAAEKTSAFSDAMADPEVVVRVAGLDAVGAGDVEVRVVAPYVDDAHPWVRSAAVAALGRLGGADARAVLEPITLDVSRPWRAADAMAAWIAAGGVPELAAAHDPVRPPQVRAEVTVALRDPEVLVALLRDESPIVRTSAGGALSEMAARVPTDVVLSLISNDDPVLRQTAIDILSKRETVAGLPPAPFVKPLVARLRDEPDADVLSAGLDLLSARAAKKPKDVPPGEPGLKDVLARALSHPAPPVRRSAAKLRQTVGADVGEVVPKAADTPAIDGAMRIRSATVRTDRGSFRIELFPEVAPIAVANFAHLVEKDFFDGVVFHRVVPAFVIQTGDPRGDGSGGPGWSIPDEVSALPYESGAVGMARAGPDTGGSQWFVTLTPQPHLVGDYTQFGRVTDGLHVVRAIERGDRVLDVTIERVDPAPRVR